MPRCLPGKKRAKLRQAKGTPVTGQGSCEEQPAHQHPSHCPWKLPAAGLPSSDFASWEQTLKRAFGFAVGFDPDKLSPDLLLPGIPISLFSETDK